jgi:uncharacterized protein (TIGR00369 family)
MKGAPSAEHLARLVELFESSRMSKTFGMALRYDDAARAVFDWRYDPAFDHFLDDVHGGVLATMLDNAGWFTAAAGYPGWVVTVEFHVRLLVPAKREDLQAVGSVLRRGQRLCTTTMELRSASGRLVATGSGTFLATGRGHPE